MKKIPILSLLTIFAVNLALAQQSAVPTKQKIADAIAAYFEYDRETIHVHLDKSVFFSNEEIWFKGYNFNKMAGTPFFETTNVYALLLDDAGRQISEQLVFSYIGAFSGNLKLDPNLPSGRYYLRFYTNWMNNFREDESNAYPIEIVNENEHAIRVFDRPDYSNVNISFHPEGGQLVRGVQNNLGVRVTDCNGYPIETRDAKIVNEKGESIGNFLVGKNGCGKTYVTPNAPLKAVVTVNGQTVEAALPAATGRLALEVNNYALAGKTILKLRGDEATTKAHDTQPLYVVIQQNNKSTIFETTLKEGGTELILGDDNFYPGINIVRIIDQNLEEFAQRIICQVPDNQQTFTFAGTKIGNGAKIVAHSNFANADLSVSILPENSKAVPETDIFAMFLVNPYLNEKLPNAAYYFDAPTKGKRYELDLYLLNQTAGKYEWRNILLGTPKNTYDFDIGLTIKGTVNHKIPDPTKYRTLLTSPMSLINDYAAIDDKKEFIYKNLVFDNVANFRFTLLEIPSIPVQTTFTHMVTNRKRPFNKPFTPLPAPCSAGRLVDMDVPLFGKDVIPLENIELKAKEKYKLKYQNQLGNAGLRGYKIVDGDVGGNLLTFIETHGFSVIRGTTGVRVINRLRTSLRGAESSPEIYVSGRRLMTHDDLQDIQMEEVDEIYLNPHAIVSSMNNNFGIIKIYMKTLGRFDSKNPTKSFEIKEGFAPLKRFEPALYNSTVDAGFENYGVIHWVPNILTDSNGDFTIEIPRTSENTVTLHIQGMTPDGKLIAIDQVVPLQ